MEEEDIIQWETDELLSLMGKHISAGIWDAMIDGWLCGLHFASNLCRDKPHRSVESILEEITKKMKRIKEDPENEI
jgi:hypothetical protein